MGRFDLYALREGTNGYWLSLGSFPTLPDAIQRANEMRYGKAPKNEYYLVTAYKVDGYIWHSEHGIAPAYRDLYENG